MEGKIALITGSTSGIGLAIAKSLAAQKVKVVLNGIASEQDVEKLKAEFTKDYAYTPLFHGADLSKKDQILDMVKFIESNLGEIDILVNNAGIQHVAMVEDFPDEKWDAIIAINLSSSFHLIKHTIGKMKAKKWGRIINVASVHGVVASANKSAYVSAKHGIIGLTKTIALEAASTGVTCNAICPGWVLTPLVQKQIDAIAEKDKISNEDAKVKLLSEKQPSKTFTNPEDIGAMAVHLCTNFANNISGSNFILDGCWTSQ
ncbi:MAG: 3-hydroxybutyrate dehydrogenase [Alphaproteobacteria bacterium 33-17]|nr:MAG: 3-hydroxybutyrate dehydrogenase [Alphaproteobacteria bacterium 33-17]